MKEEVRKRLCQVMSSAVLAGIILLLTGLYYCMIKAGIPYQDPPPELQIQYMVNMRIGEILLGKGFLLTLCAGVIRLLLGLLQKRGGKSDRHQSGC
ncbi:MAG: hypothetical protein HFI38_07120 [Lachnospiraceae bacterium]|jgi:hypothetical protein|nr:hypothetical protein [Lachnospiraceae bacterium]